jgi:polysaccharide export outer membrane protein
MRAKGRHRRSWMPALLLLIGLAGCAPGGDLPWLPAPSAAPYRLGPGDRIRILTYGVEQLSGPFRVGDSGNIDLPLLGSVHAAGLTTSELGNKIAAELVADQLMREPSVAVEVEEFRPVFILGEVNKPGEYPYKPGMTMLTAVAIAGGFTYRAVEDYALIVRVKDGSAAVGRVLPQGGVAPGDVVRIFERHF